MMLSIHIGTEKTGSSHLQSMCALNREALQQQGIWFSRADKVEAQMTRGDISPGNAQPLADLLNSGDTEAAKSWLRGMLQAARDHECNHLLLSNELLVLSLSGNGQLAAFLDICRQLDCSVRFLLILRDPVDQALSLYKHRAKRGKAEAIEKWVAGNFHYGKGLDDFFAAAREEQLDLSCRKYASTPGYLESVFFTDWLGVPVPAKKLKKVVNPSLSISELLFIKKLRAHNVWLANAYYDRMLKIPKGEKSKDRQLEHYYRQVLGGHLAQYETTWLHCNEWLPEGEPLHLPAVAAGQDHLQGQDMTLTFSEKQVEAITAFLSESTSTGFQLELKKRQLRQTLGQFKNRILNTLSTK